MPRLNQRGAIQFIIPIILLLGIIGVVYLVTKGPLKIFPKASVSQPIDYPTTGFEFAISGGITKYNVGDRIEVKVLAHSDISAANLFEAKLNFNKDLLAVDSIETPGDFIKNWVEKYSDNNTGTISLVGGVSNPGHQTSVGNPGLMAMIYFKALKAGNATVSFSDDSAIYSNADNTNILTTKDSVTLSISSGATPPPYVCSACDADINQDGVVTILDFSALAVCFNKEATTSAGTQSCSRADINGSGRVTIEDFNCLADKFNKSCSQGAETRPDAPMDQATRRSLQAQLERAAATPSPPPLPADSSYSRVFVTSTTYNGNLGGLSGADAKCQDRANEAKLGGFWKAWLSDMNTSAASRLIHNNVPYKLIDGTVVADNWNDLTDGTLQNPINLKEDNTRYNYSLGVWTDTSTDGKSNSAFLSNSYTVGPCYNWTKDEGIALTGSLSSTNADWTSLEAPFCRSSRKLYCFEQAAAPVATPVPGTGDGNNDGKINLVDLSVLLTDFNKESGFRRGIDLNGDGKINTFDFSLMRNLLIQKGVIRG